MKKKFTLSLILLLSITMSALAAEPVVPANNVTFPTAEIDGNRLQIRFNKGDGNMRIVVMKEGSPVSSTPSNGTDYTASSSFGNPLSEFNTNDGYVVYRNGSVPTSVSVTVSNLNHSTRYYVSVWEFNGTGTATQYLMTAATGNEMTKSPPTQQVQIASFTLVTGNKMTLNLSGGNGDWKLVLARKGAPVNTTPEMLRDYSSSGIFESGAVINTDNYVVYKGQGSIVNITNLEPNTLYHFAVFAYNGEAGPVYLTPGSIASRTTNAGPTAPSGTLNFNNPEGNRISLFFSLGTGKHQLIIARKGAAVTAQPVNGATYRADKSFGDGEAIEPGQFVVNTTAGDRTFTNMDPASVYHFRVYDYDVDKAGNTYYLTSAFSEAPGQTVSAPTSLPGNVTFDQITGSGARINYTYPAGSSSYRMIVMKQGSPVDAVPTDLVNYNGSTTFGNPTYQLNPQTTPGNYIIQGQSNSSSGNVTGLTAGMTYHVAVFAMNGNDYPMYATTAATGILIIPNEPTGAGNNFSASVEGNSASLQWQNGNGTRKIIIARKGAAVTARPADGVTYTAQQNFDEGTAVEPGQFVVYDGTARTAPVRKLDPGSTYHFAIFEYNVVGTSPDYLTSAFLAGQAITLSAPTSQASITNVSNIQATSATISFAAGNGGGRLIVMRAGAAVNAEPQNLTSYSPSSSFGGSWLAGDNAIVQKTSGITQFNVTSLTANTHYFISVFEFNGSSAPMYMKPGGTYDFTTASSNNGTPLPTINASNPSFDEIDGKSFKFDWDNGDGAKRIVVARAGAPVSFTPTDGATYQFSSAFGSTTDLGNGQYVVANTSTDNVSLTNLDPFTIYHFAVFEFNGTGTATKYLTTNVLTASRSTAIRPAGGSTGVNVTTQALTITITWNSGPGDRRLVVLKAGGAVNGNPADLSEYPAEAAFTQGTQIAAGEYVVYGSTGNSVTITGLQDNTTYHYAIFDYNGLHNPIYNTANKITGSKLLSTTLPLSWLFIKAFEENNGDIKVEWATAMEDNTSHFIVERSQSSGAFVQIGNLPAKGSEIRNDYSFTDQSHPAGTVSYRVKQVDKDGRYSYSKQVVVRAINQQSALKLYPNPAPGHTRISLPQGVQQAALSLYDLRGALVKTAAVSNGELISLQGLPKGIYHVVVNDGSNQYKERLIVQ